MSDVAWKDIPPQPLNFGQGNSVVQGEDFYVSYAADTSGNIFATDDDGEETALVHEQKFYILNGDYRKDYERLIPQGYEACLEFFKSKPKSDRSKWSNDPAE